MKGANKTVNVPISRPQPHWLELLLTGESQVQPHSDTLSHGARQTAPVVMSPRTKRAWHECLNVPALTTVPWRPFLPFAIVAADVFPLFAPRSLPKSPGGKVACRGYALLWSERCRLRGVLGASKLRSHFKDYGHFGVSAGGGGGVGIHCWNGTARGDELLGCKWKGLEAARGSL